MSNKPGIAQLQVQRELLRVEYQEEKEAYRLQTESMGLARKVTRGDAWFPLRVGRTYYNSVNQFCIEVTRQADEEIDHNFEYGKPVVFFKAETPEGDLGQNARIQYFNFTGTISYVDGNRMVVAIPEGHTLELQNAQEPVGVQLFFDETSYRIMFDALDRVIVAKGNRLAYLRDLFYSHQPAETFTFDAMRFPWLNTSQEHAVNDVLRSKDVRVLHGPPGTGKTTTLVEAINETLMRETQVLVCAQSNTAVDWISEKLVDCGIKVLRLGNPTRVNDKMLSFTYEHRFADHPDYPKLWQVRRTMREMRRRRRESGEHFHQKLDRLKELAVELEVRINADIFGQVRVIASTLVGAGNKLLDGKRFGTVFIDEAAQALEAACWIPIRRASRVIFAGDHCQLPPTIKSLEAIKGGLGITLMERIVKNKPECVSLLQVQYRMNDEIMQFSSDYFYHGLMKSAPEVAHRVIHEGDTPIVWLDTSTIDVAPDDQFDFREQFVGESFGRINKGEAHLTISLLQIYIQRIGKQRVLDERIDVGIISPYRAQVQYLKRLIKKRPFFKPYRHLISVNTVDGFQGQERDVILISMVRANGTGQIGFLHDLRRMNVAITRARMKLIIVGDVPTLTRHPFYRRLFNYIQEVHGFTEGTEKTEGTDRMGNTEGKQ
ncbi:MAG: AAA family ATPase [Muribaculaceae bacterium]|nr:AAA family ATPase [Muribaculaceae bacterium]